MPELVNEGHYSQYKRGGWGGWWRMSKFTLGDQSVLLLLPWERLSADPEPGSKVNLLSMRCQSPMNAPY